jgi:glucan 1,3-beta-glucosidase
MRFSTVSSFALAIAPLAVSAASGRLGFALGTKKADGTCKYQADYESDFKLISAASGSKIVRGYSASDCNAAQNILPAAKSQGFQVILGIW